MTERKIVIAPGTTTRVSKITVGRPVRRVTQSSITFGALRDIDDTNKTDGSLLVYNSTTEKWEATLLLEKQNINGGSY